MFGPDVRPNLQLYDRDILRLLRFLADLVIPAGGGELRNIHFSTETV
jgi:hypothetical protein